MKKIITSVFVIALAAGATWAGTSAFFSDSESSLGNTLVAGDIDLLIDNESYAIDWNIPDYQNPVGAFVRSTATTWDARDLTIERFFDFVDLKPGDYGEDTISIRTGTNDAWVCAAARITDDHDNTYVDPEYEDDTTTGEDPTAFDGELDEEVNFAFWVDDGDNVFETDEQVFLDGPISALGGAGQIALADSESSILTNGAPLPGGETFYIGKYWCFGEMEQSPVAPGDEEGRNPINAGTGFTCSGASVDNAAQTDLVRADIQFYAEQHRNNETFQCSQWTPEWPRPEANVTADTTWSAVDLDQTNGQSTNVAGGAEQSEWFAKARNNNGGFELAIGTDDDDAGSQDTAEAVWEAGVQENFTLSYDGAGNATLTVAGETPVTFAVGAVGTLARIGVNVKAPVSETTTIDNLALSVAGPLSDDDISVTGGTASLLITGVDLNQAWDLTGTFVFSAVGTPPFQQENPAVQFSID